MRPTALFLLLPLQLVAGCGRDAGKVRHVAARDSAGVRIVDLGAGEARHAWTVAATPAVDITGGEPGQGPALYQALGAARLGDGRIVVANAGSGTLDFYTPDGRHQRSAGHAGGGPGEFRALTWVGSLPGDSVAAWDSGSGRLSVFTPAGEFARSVTPRQPLGMFPQAQGTLEGGELLLMLHQAAPGGAPTSTVHVQRGTVHLASMARDGAVKILGRFPGTEMLASGNPAGGLMMMPLPFGKQTVAAAHRGRVYVSGGDRWEVAEYGADGRVRSLIRSARPRQPVTRADVRAYARTMVMLGGEGNAALARQRSQLLAMAPYPKVKPAVTGLRADAERNLWMESPGPAAGTVDGEWTVVSPREGVLARVQLPRGLNVQQVGPDWILGTSMDGDMEHVRLYRLTRAP